MKKLYLGLLPSLLLAAPSAPSNLHLKALSTSSVSISWQDNASTETGYKIYRDGRFIATVGANIHNYTDKDLAPNTTYTYTLKASDDAYYNNVLFAHGYKGDEGSWDIFADYITSHQEPWNIYRYSVGKEDSISTRATQLAQYINSENNIADNSLVAIGHSMGGLDLRYIVSQGHKHQDDHTNIFYKAAKKISAIYTLATPHKGINDVGIDDATEDMTKPNMKIFNESNPYSIFNIEDRPIPLLAYRFVCDEARLSDGSGAEDDSGLDGLLKVKTQIFNGAPYTQSVFRAKHTADTLCLGSYDEEKERTDILQNILDKELPYSDVADIVFFEGASCQGEESGVFSSHYKVGGVNCRTEDSCENNEIASMMLFPGIKKGTLISLFSDSSDDGSDDWATIDIGQATLSKPLCIESFEHSYTDKTGISLTYHDRAGGEDGLDGKVSYIDVSE
jgi:hypothetical protein